MHWNVKEPYLVDPSNKDSISNSCYSVARLDEPQLDQLLTYLHNPNLLFDQKSQMFWCCEPAIISVMWIRWFVATSQFSLDDFYSDWLCTQFFRKYPNSLNIKLNARNSSSDCKSPLKITSIVDYCLPVYVNEISWKVTMETINSIHSHSYMTKSLYFQKCENGILRFFIRPDLQV